MNSYELFLALRYLKGNKKTLGGSLTSIIAIGGVTVGVAALIATLAVMTGFREDIRNKILGAQPHLFIQPGFGESLADKDWSEKFQGAGDVVAWGPYVMGQALIRRGSESRGLVVKGVDPDREPQVTGLDRRLKEGDWNRLRKKGEKEPAVFLGKELASGLGVGIGDRVILAVPTGEEGLMGGLPAFSAFTVAGILDTGLYDYDSSLAVISLASAQSLFGMKNALSGLGVRLKDADDFMPSAMILQKNFSSLALVRSWLAMNRPLFSALKLEKAVMFLILTLITVVAAFTILSNLLLVTAQKVREIGILRAMGASKGSIQKIFLLKGMMMGALGTGAGVVLGVLIALAIRRYQFIQLPADVYYVEKVPVRIVPGDVAGVALAALVIVLLATLYPARAASRLDPLDAVRS